MVSCSQTAYDMAWTQQIDKEFHAADTGRLRGGLLRSTGPRVAPHSITGFVPLESKFQLQKERLDKMDMSAYSTGMPFRGIYTRRNNPEAIQRMREKVLSSAGYSSGLVTPKSGLFHRFHSLAQP